MLASYHLPISLLPSKMLALMIPQSLALHELLSTSTASVFSKPYMVLVVQLHHIHMVPEASPTDLTGELTILSLVPAVEMFIQKQPVLLKAQIINRTLKIRRRIKMHHGVVVDQAVLRSK